MTDQPSDLHLAVIDYGMGNLASVQNAFAFLGVAATATSDAGTLAAADAIILPGVGAFGEAMANLRRLDLVAPLVEEVRGKRKPFLGICLGMQLLAEVSHELGRHQGLGLIEGEIECFPGGTNLRVPHVGWSSFQFGSTDPLFAGIPEDGCFYFDHTYYLPPGPTTIGTANYGVAFTAALRADNVFATQFHPEKSQRNGLKMLRNFTNYCLARKRAA